MAMTAIVSGANSGIGLACTRLLLEKGVSVVGLDLNVGTLERLSGALLPVAVDISNSEGRRQSILRAAEYLGHIDTFLHFAGAWSGASWEHCTELEWDRILAINLKGAFFLTKEIAVHMVAQRRGSIVLTGSETAKTGGVASGVAYVSSKGGILALTRNLAAALGPHGVRVNAINPGVVETPMTSQWSKDFKMDLISRTPLRRLAAPDDVAEAACFLALEQSRFITGEVLEVNGGHHFG